MKTSRIKPIVLCGLLLAAILLLCACQAYAANAVPTPAPTEAPTPEQIEAVVVHETPEPTEIQTPIPTPEPTEIPTPEPTPEPTATPQPRPTPFSIVWMSDTQVLSRHHPDIFNGMRDWILQNREEYNIVFVVHTGDVVDGCSQFMWDAATEALVPIFTEIPGMIVSGNHDVSREIRQSLFTRQPYAQEVLKEGQLFKDGEAAYAKFEAGEDEFLVFGLGYAVRGYALLDWIETVTEQHPNATVLYVMHYGLQQDGRYSGQARDLVETVVKDNPKARLLLCGHYDGALLRTEQFDDDGDGEAERSFTTMMFNYQDDRENGLGFMRILTFDPEERSISVRTYSPWYDLWGYSKAAPEENTFVLENAF